MTPAPRQLRIGRPSSDSASELCVPCGCALRGLYVCVCIKTNIQINAHKYISMNISVVYTSYTYIYILFVCIIHAGVKGL